MEAPTRGVEIRPYYLGEENKIVQLLTESFNGWPKFDLPCSSLDYWRWRHGENIYGKNSVIVACINDEIIGCTHTDSYLLKLLDGTCFAGTGNDLSVHRDYRRKGISNRLHKDRTKYRIERGLEYGLANPGPSFMKRKRAQTLPEFPNPIKQYVKIYDLDRHFEAMPEKNISIKKMGYSALKKLQDLRDIFHTNSQSKIYEVYPVEKFDETFNDFLKLMNRYYKFTIYLDINYLNWRFCDPSSGGYKVYAVEENNNIVGYFVNRINRYNKDYPIGFIVDNVYHPEKPDILDTVLNESLSLFETNNVNLIEVLLTQGNPDNIYFHRRGFVDRRQSYTIYYELYAQEDKINQLRGIDPRTIHYSYWDLDII